MSRYSYAILGGSEDLVSTMMCFKKKKKIISVVRNGHDCTSKIYNCSGLHVFGFTGLLYSKTNFLKPKPKKSVGDGQWDSIEPSRFKIEYHDRTFAFNKTIPNVILNISIDVCIFSVNIYFFFFR